MRYQNLFSPLTIGAMTLKNRISTPDCSLHLLQGPETFPADGYRTWMIQMAKNSAYIITNPWNNPTQRTVGAEDHIRMQRFDVSDPSVTNYMSKMCDDIHFYGSKLFLSVIPFEFPWPEGFGLCQAGNGIPLPGGEKQGESMAIPGMKPSMELPAERMHEVVSALADLAEQYHSYGFDGFSIPISILIGKNQNRRTDQYGCDTPQNAARLAKEIFAEMKRRLGADFLTEAYVYGEMERIYTTEFMAQVVKELEHVVDIVSIKEKDAAVNHPTGFQFRKGEHPVFGYAKAIREIGADVVVGVNGGFQDPEEMERHLKAGEVDMFAMARGLICEEEYVEKCLSEKEADILPCIWCNKCHGTMKAPWITFCSVNPKLGIDPMILENLPEVHPKKVAVVGGGPIGMRAALMAREQGHQVTIFEKTGYLGGQLYHSDYVSFKWPLRDYKNWLKMQLERKGVEIRLNTEATPDGIAKEGFEAVIAATGAVPNIPRFAQKEDGTIKEGLMTCLDVFGNEDKLGKRVIIVGGSETGVETGMHLCETGHEVTVLTRQAELAHDASKLHSITMAIVEFDPVDLHEIHKPAWAKYPDFHGVTNANTKEVTANSVTYQDPEGKLHTLYADNIVICGGMRALRDEALRFYGSAPRFLMTGDCEKVANLQAGNRSAMGKVAML